MGARKEHRDAQASRRYFDRILEDHRRAGNADQRALNESHQRLLDGYAAQVDTLQAQADTLRGDVGRLEAEKAGLAEALETERRRADRMAGWAAQMKDNWLAEKANRQELSQIVSLALTPEQYHNYRQIVKETTQ